MIYKNGAFGIISEADISALGIVSFFSIELRSVLRNADKV